MFTMKFPPPDRSRQTAILDRIRENIKKEAIKEAIKKQQEKKNGT